MTGVRSPLSDGRPPPVADPRVGTVLGDRYRIDALLGEGGMGKVYAAEHVLMRKRLAVKVLHRELTTVPEVVARFEREAMAAAHIEHPNVAAATDFGKLPDGSVFLVLEYVQGISLRDEIARGPFPVERAARIARQIASALASAHALEIVHRDLKPENVMLVEKGGDPDFAKVLDFGIARVPIGEIKPGVQGSGDSPITKVGMVFGTPEYMAPEQALGQPVDGRADLYALGVILFEMLAGVRPFSSKNPVGILGQQLSKPPPTFSERAPGISIPPQVENVVRTLLARDVGDRYQKANDVVVAIDVAMGISPGARLFTMAAGSRQDMMGSQPGTAPIPRPKLASSSGNFEAASASGGMPAASPSSSALPAFPLSTDHGIELVPLSPDGADDSGTHGPLPPLPVPPQASSPGVVETSLEAAKLRLTASARTLSGLLVKWGRGGRVVLDAARALPARGRGGRAILDAARALPARSRAAYRGAVDFVETRRANLPPKIQKLTGSVPSPAIVGAAALIALGFLVALVGIFVFLLKPSPQQPLTASSSRVAAQSAVPAQAASTKPPLRVSGDTAPEAEIGAARSAGISAVEELAGRYPKDANPLIELAQLDMNEKQHSAAIANVTRALDLDPKIGSDPRVEKLLIAGGQARDSAEATFALLTGKMGYRGADIVFELATSDGIRPETKARAERWLSSPEFDRASSPALNVTVALVQAKTCQQRYGLLLRAKNAGDERTLAQLKRLTERTGCGHDKSDDCNACLRADDRLDVAIQTLEKKKG